MIRIGTRGSLLALWQAKHVQSLLQGIAIESRLLIITTTGDRLLDRRLQNVGGKGAFLKEIEEALLANQVDLAVHSLKDVPTALPEGLHLCAYLERADPRDALLSNSGVKFEALPRRARVGTTSLRRRAQVQALRPDLVLEDLRGNVDTRLKRLQEGRFDAILLAMAGLTRLGRTGAVTQILDPDVLLPAAGQGTIALECRADDVQTAEVVKVFDDPPTARAVRAERAFLARLGVGCNVPVGAFAESQNEQGGLRLRALVAREDGTQILRGERPGTDPERLGVQVAEELLARGAGALLAT